tara:strand:+ start:380 stop:589 length:210 start_codon:yes stop_codon:yes gene_type:complete
VLVRHQQVVLAAAVLLMRLAVRQDQVHPIKVMAGQLQRGAVKKQTVAVVQELLAGKPLHQRLVVLVVLV